MAADRNFELGRQAALQGEYVTACNLFGESYRLDPAVGTLINLGDCNEHLGNFEEARGYYQRAFRELKSDDERVQLVATRLSSLERRAARLDVQLGPDAAPGTTVLVDGRVVAPGTTLMVQAGAHVVTATAVGFKGSRQSLTMTEGEQRRLVVWPGPPLEATAPPEPAPPPADRANTWTLVGWGATGVGAASLWAASVTGLFALDRESTRSDHCDADNVCDGVGLAAAQSGSTFATASTVTGIVGLSFLAAGVYILVTSPHGASAPPARSAAAPRSPHSLLWTGRF